MIAMISVTVFVHALSFITMAQSSEVPYGDDIKPPTDATNTAFSWIEDMKKLANESVIKNASQINNHEQPPDVSLSKALTVEDKDNLNEFNYTESMLLSSTDNSNSLVTSSNDLSDPEHMPTVGYRGSNESSTMSTKVKIAKDEEEAFRIRSTQHLYYDTNAKSEGSMYLSTDLIATSSMLPSSTPEKENSIDIESVSADSVTYGTSSDVLDKESIPYYFSTEKKDELEMLENKTQTTSSEPKKDVDQAESFVNVDGHNISLIRSPSFRSVDFSYDRFSETEPKVSETDFHKPIYISTTQNQELQNEFYATSKTTGMENYSTEYSIENNDDQKQTRSEYNAGDDVSVLITDPDESSNSTRFPKRIQGVRDRYPTEARVRPARPDPGYNHREEMDIVRPYRPDSPIHQYPYYRPTPDYRTPVIRQDTDYTRPARPDPDTPRASFKPNYSYSKSSTSTRQPSSEPPTAKPYRPSFNRPYVPQGSFGRPFRPEYLRPSSKPSEDMTYKASTSGGSSTHDAELFEHSRADYEYTRQSESGSAYSKVRPAIETAANPSPMTDEDTVKVAIPNIETARPHSFYPKPGFGGSPSSDTSIKPFSIGTVISAKNLTRVEYIKADCFDNYMKVTMRFNGTFDGLIYSSGYAQDSSCSYVNGSGRNHYEFFIRLNRCGTLGQQEVSEDTVGPLTRRRQERAQYLVNTVTVQYNAVIEEDIDEHFRVTCEYGYDFWKTVTFPVINVESASVKLRTGSPVVFTLPPPQCNMEVRSGFGPSGTRITGPVNVGDPITLVIHMKSESTGFDILVSNCFAHNGAQKRLQLIDSHGCVVEEKLISPFRGVSSPDRSQQVTLYSYLKAFRFTGSPALYLECDVHMCHGSCPPQRCYWRSLYKRSAEEATTQSLEESGVLSESVSLFQALEVRHVEVDSPLALRKSQWTNHDDMVCIGTGGFAAISSCVLLLLLLTTFVAVCMCLRMRKMKFYMETPDTKHFVDFDGHIPLK